MSKESFVNEVCCMDAVTLAKKIRSKQLSPVEVVDAVITRMEKLEPYLHAFCTPTVELARKKAKQIEKKIMAGSEVGPLAGVPVGIKDLICTKDIRTVSGSIAYKDFVPEEDDVSVERLKNAGAIILGKTVTSLAFLYILIDQVKTKVSFSFLIGRNLTGRSIR